MIDKRTKAEFSRDLMRRAPQETPEFQAFSDAAHYYELAVADKTMSAPSYRMRAVRAFKKGFKLREERLNKQQDL